MKSKFWKYKLGDNAVIVYKSPDNVKGYETVVGKIVDIDELSVSVEDDYGNVTLVGKGHVYKVRVRGDKNG